jgi:ubiquinone biosynthesis protein COQ9
MPKMDPFLKEALEIIGKKGWSHFELKDLANDKTSLADVYAHFPARLSILEALGKYIDQATLENLDVFGPSETPKDRLFSIMMTRFDAMTPLKPFIKTLWQDGWKEPLTIVSSLPMGLNSMTWLLQAADVDTTGIHGALRVKAFAVCYLSTVWAWLADDTLESEQTMVELDKNLQRLTNLPGW